LDEWLQVGVVHHVGLQYLRVREVSGQEVFNRVELEVTQGDIGCRCSREGPPDPVLDRNATESRVSAQELDGSWHVSVDVVGEVKSTTHSIRIEDADFDHGILADDVGKENRESCGHLGRNHYTFDAPGAGVGRGYSQTFYMGPG
jgi:hypothetical protein